MLLGGRVRKIMVVFFFFSLVGAQESYRLLMDGTARHAEYHCPVTIFFSFLPTGTSSFSSASESQNMPQHRHTPRPSPPILTRRFSSSLFIFCILFFFQKNFFSFFISKYLNVRSSYSVAISSLYTAVWSLSCIAPCYQQLDG